MIYNNKQKSAGFTPVSAATSCGALDAFDIRLCDLPLQQQINEIKKQNNDWLILGLHCVNSNTEFTHNTNNQQLTDEMTEFDNAETINTNEKSKEITLNNPQILNLIKNKAIILVVGNESQGLSKEIQNICDYFINIPVSQIATQHNIDSLNVASALSVVLYQLTQT